jgi:hypothetical protein
MAVAGARGRLCLVLAPILAVSCALDDPRPVPARGGAIPDPSAAGGGNPSSGGGGAAGSPGGGAAGTSGAITSPTGPFMPGPCADLFADDLLPTYELQIAPAEWNALVNDFNTMQQNIDAGRNYHPYHALAEFKYGDEVVRNALIRLKGWSSWRQAVNDKPPKMQFVIAFNEIDRNARFHGQRKLELDMPRIDQTYVRQRIALAYMRAVGLPAQCANNARVFINGAYYGLYTNLERPDKTFIQRVFPGADGGDLWDYGGDLSTNEDTIGLPHPRLEAFWAATTPEATAAIADMDEALLEWAAEAMFADADGYWIGHWNWFIYDHPARGWLWIPHDLDAVINWTDPRIDPMYYWGAVIGPWQPPRQHYLAVIKDRRWSERYVASLRYAHQVYTGAGLPEMLDRFTAQVRDAAAADPTRPFSFETYLSDVAYLRQSFFTRGDSVRDWLDCRAAPGGARDDDGDGRPFCMDCDDGDPTTYPGAPEICGDKRDQDCDGSEPAPCR